MKLEKATPYMLRDDGVVLRCGIGHPYLIADVHNYHFWPDYELFMFRSSDIMWFYNNTNNVDIRNHLRTLSASYRVVHPKEKEQWDDRNKDMGITQETYITGNVAELDELLWLTNKETNNEFCRFRTSNQYAGGSSGDIYFRISSTGVNWFNKIWDIVYHNKNFIDSVTVVKDEQSLETVDSPNEFYKINGQKLDRFDTDDFITLGGKPIIEHCVDKDTYFYKYINKINNRNTLFESVCGNLFSKHRTIHSLDIEEKQLGYNWFTK